MDFNKLKNKLIESKNKAVEKSAEILWNSIFTIKDLEWLKEIIEKSWKTVFTDKKTGEVKEFNKKAIIVFWDENSDFFKEALIVFSSSDLPAVFITKPLNLWTLSLLPSLINW